MIFERYHVSGIMNFSLLILPSYNMTGIQDAT